MTLKLYYDLMSQPSRALYITLKASNYKFEPKYLDLRKGEHYSEEYTRINRFQRVPVIDHDGFVLSESIAILKYLSRENIIPDALYPKNSKLQARVEEFLEWQHTGIRIHCAMYFRVKHMDPILSGSTPDEKRVLDYERRMMNALEDFDDKWLQRGNDFIAGKTITIADLLAACEIEQPRMAGFDAKEVYPNIKKWMTKVQQHFSPYYEEAHVTLNKVVEARLTKATAKL